MIIFAGSHKVNSSSSLVTRAHAFVVCGAHVFVIRNSRVMFPSTQLLSDNKSPVTVINDKGSVPVCFLCAAL